MDSGQLEAVQFTDSERAIGRFIEFRSLRVLALFVVFTVISLSSSF